MQLRVCDFRNAKFQGETIAREPQGFGFAIDDNYTTLLSEWDRGNIEYPFLAIFGNSSKVYGDYLDHSDNFLVYSDRECKIFKSNNRVVVDYFPARVLILVSGHSLKSSSIITSQEKKKIVIID